MLKHAILSFLALDLATGHPGDVHDVEVMRREASVQHAIAEAHQNELNKCSASSQVSERKERAMERRLETFLRLRAERGLSDNPFLHRRDTAAFTKWNSKSHDQTEAYPDGVPPKSVFDANTSCIFTPDNADGPYFVQGELQRSNITEDVQGIPVHLEMQFVDVNTCQPATQLLIDVWACNALGKYSGVSAAGEGGLESSYLRGFQLTDEDGVVSFDTIFPGHYQGRASHQHIIAHTNATVLPNSSYTGGQISHISQFFFDQSLVDAVEATQPYRKNNITRTSNAADMFTGYSATDAYDPFPEYVLLGGAGDLSKGLFMWLEVGLNVSADLDYYAPPASYVWAEGTKDNPAFESEMFIVGTPPPTHG